MTDSLSSVPLAELLDRLGSKQPTPGGGAVAGVTGALAAATARMVVAYSLGRTSLADHQQNLERHDAALARSRDLFLGLADEDAEAYAALNALWRLPKDDADRAARLPEAAGRAAAVPMSAAAAGVDLLKRIEALVPITNRQLVSDLGVAGETAAAAVRAALWNVRANLPLLDERARAVAADELDGLLRSASTLSESIAGKCVGGG
ncbi:MAG: cyclodeaminase/cyclohydrolase family protein [Planctomycetota bacterium]